MHRRMPMLAAIVTVSLLQGCVLFDMHRASEDRRFSVMHVEGSSLDVTSRNGSIEVIADDAVDEVIVEVRLTCGGSSPAVAKERLTAATVVIERDTSRMLTIRPEFPGGAQNNDGASITVRLPGADGASLSTSNGRVTARGLAGALVVNTSNGRVIVDDHDGEAQLRTSNGRIEVRGLNGSLDARTSNGRVHVALTEDATGPVRVHSSNGSIMAIVGAAFRGRIEFDTSNGRIKVSGSEERLVRERIRGSNGFAVLGAADGPESLLDTSNGSIELHVLN